MSLNLPKVVFFGRTLEEYERFWMLPIAEFPQGPVLDCPSGPTDFVSRARALGVNVTGVDPAYALDPDGLAALGTTDIELTVAAIRAHGNTLAGADPDKWGAAKHAALTEFLEDFRRHPPGRAEGPDNAQPRYHAAALPDLPFPDQAFDLVLSGHLLFCYAAVGEGGIADSASAFDLAWHLEAIDELARVTRHELRLYPVSRCDQPPGSGEHPYLAPVMARLAEHGFTPNRATPDYDQGVDPEGALLIATR